MKQKKVFNQWLFYFTLAVAVIILYKVIDNVGAIGGWVGQWIGVLTPFVIGFAIAFLLYAPCHGLDSLLKKAKWKWLSGHSRGVAVLAVYLVFIGVMALLIYLVIPALINMLIEFGSASPTYYKNVVKFLETHSHDNVLMKQIDVTAIVDRVFAWLKAQLTTEKLLSYARGLLSFTTSLLDVLMGIIISIYMLLGKENLLHACRNTCGTVIPENGLRFIGKYARKIARIFYSYFYSQCIDALIVSVLATIGMLIAGLPHAPLLGLMLGFMNFIPYFGAIIGGVVCALVALLTGNIYTALFVAVYILVMQQIDGNIIQPHIVGSTVGMKAIYVLLAITIGGGFFGFWGIFLAVPAMAVLQMLIHDYLDFRRAKRTEKAALTEEENDDETSADSL